MLPKAPAPSAQIPRRTPTLSGLSRPKTTYRHSNPLGDSRYSLNYSEYIYEEYGRPSPSVAVFSGEDEPCLMRSVSQRPVEPPPLRRTRSSETIVPQTLVLGRNESVISAPGARLDRWLVKQEEYFGTDKPAPISTLPSLPQDPRLPDVKPLQPVQRRNSVSAPGDFWPSARDIPRSPSPRFPSTEENSSCVGIPYSAMLPIKNGGSSVVSSSSSNTYHVAPSSVSSVPQHPQYASELEAIPSGTGKRAMESPTDSATPNRPTGFEADRLV